MLTYKPEAEEEDKHEEEETYSTIDEIKAVPINDFLASNHVHEPPPPPPPQPTFNSRDPDDLLVNFFFY